MLLFPNCKINLGLTITGKRTDGYHDIETIFYPVPLKDALELLPIKQTTDSTNSVFSSTGIAIAGADSDNLCVKAYTLLKHHFPGLPATAIHLHKAIPMGAGLGGGSADGAFTLIGLNQQYELGLSTDQLMQYALQLGSDCPFFILNKPCLGTGRGEQLTPIDLNLSGYRLVVVNPGIHVNTGWAFSQLNLAAGTGNGSGNQLLDIIREPINTWQHTLFNHFEGRVFEKYPEIGQIKQTLYDKGCVYSAMSGSGSTVFGIFEGVKRFSPNIPAHYLVKEVLL